MNGFIIFIIIAVVLAVIITAISSAFETKEEKRFIKSQMVSENEITFTNDSEYKQAVITQMQSINNNLVNIQIQNDKQRKMIEDIHSIIMFIVFITIISVLIKGVLIFTALNEGNNIIQDLTSNFNTTPQATAVVTDDEGNIIEDEEYHGQNIAIPSK